MPITLTTRLVALVVVTVTLSLAFFVGLTAYRVEGGARVHEASVNNLIRARVANEMRLQIRIVFNEFDRLEAETSERMAALARRVETATILAQGDASSIGSMLQTATLSGNLNSIVALDASLEPVGSNQPGLDMGELRREFGQSQLSLVANRLIENRNQLSARYHSVFFPTASAYANSVGLPDAKDGLLLVTMHPVFDKNGAVSALLVGHRATSLSQKFLSEYLREEKLGVQIMDGTSLLFSAGHAPGIDRNAPRAEFGVMGISTAGRDLFQCAPFRSDWRLCIYEPVEQLTGLTGSLFQFIDNEKQSLSRWLTGLAVLATALSLLVAWFGTRRVLAPLAQITQAVRSVARGNWLAHVSGERRRDEVGRIARAVIVLQKSMKEREKLIADVADIDQVRARKVSIEVAVQACQTDLRARLLNLSDLAEDAESGGAKLASLAGLAEGEADEARLVAQRVLTVIDEADDVALDQAALSERSVTGSIDRLGETVSTFSTSTQDVATTINTIVQEVRGLERGLIRFLSDVAADDGDRQRSSGQGVVCNPTKG